MAAEREAVSNEEVWRSIKSIESFRDLLCEMRVENPSLCRAASVQFNGDVIKGESEVLQVSYCTSNDHQSSIHLTSDI